MTKENLHPKDTSAVIESNQVPYYSLICGIPMPVLAVRAKRGASEIDFLIAMNQKVIRKLCECNGIKVI